MQRRRKPRTNGEKAGRRGREAEDLEQIVIRNQERSCPAAGAAGAAGWLAGGKITRTLCFPRKGLALRWRVAGMLGTPGVAPACFRSMRAADVLRQSH